jgi:hypothetical protein
MPTHLHNKTDYQTHLLVEPQRLPKLPPLLAILHRILNRRPHFPRNPLPPRPNAPSNLPQALSLSALLRRNLLRLARPQRTQPRIELRLLGLEALHVAHEVGGAEGAV